MTLVTVSEHASLTTECVPEQSLRLAQVTTTAFDHLCKLSERFQRSGARLVQVEGRSRLRLDNHVGVIQTPCGTTVEILPKHTESGQEFHAGSRRLLRRLLQSMFDLTAREAGRASLESFDAPLSEWVMARFLEELDRVVQRGLRFDYQRVQEEQPFLRGQLDVMAQLRQPPGRDQLFQVRHDVFTPDRPENRLLRAALAIVQRQTTAADNWRLAHELSVRLAEVRPSTEIEADFRNWGLDRLLSHYRPARPWCEIILRHAMPLALQGTTQGLSLLFPMEKLFERHLAACLRRQLVAACRIRTPAASQYLCDVDQERIFRLEPDILIEHGERQAWIVDAKWKQLDETRQDLRFGLSQGDFYQLYAYGQKYLCGAGDMALVYPRNPRLTHPLGPFRFTPSLRVHVLPFDLEDDTLIGAGVLGLPWRQPQASLPAAASPSPPWNLKA